MTAVDPKLAFRGFQLMNLKHDKLLSNFACFGFNRNLRPYSMAIFNRNETLVGRCRLTPGFRS